MPFTCTLWNKDEFVCISQKRGHDGLFNADTPTILTQHILHSQDLSVSARLLIILKELLQWETFKCNQPGRLNLTLKLRQTYRKLLRLKLCGRVLDKANIWFFKGNHSEMWPGRLKGTYRPLANSAVWKGRSTYYIAFSRLFHQLRYGLSYYNNVPPHGGLRYDRSSFFLCLESWDV